VNPLDEDGARALAAAAAGAGLLVPPGDVEPLWEEWKSRAAYVALLLEAKPDAEEIGLGWDG
jgi:hypothetical protein